MTDRRQPAGHPANSTKYKKLRRAFMRARGPVGRCALCGDPVDMTLSGRATMGPSIDHVVPTSAGGSFFDVSNWQLAHRSCNARKGRGETVGIARRAGSPTPGDPRYCWKRGPGRHWEHYNPIHGYHTGGPFDCEWPGCPNAE